MAPPPARELRAGEGPPRLTSALLPRILEFGPARTHPAPTFGFDDPGRAERCAPYLRITLPAFPLIALPSAPLRQGLEGWTTHEPQRAFSGTD